MSTTTLDPLAPATTVFPVGQAFVPATDAHRPIPEAVSFGMSRVRPMPPASSVDMSGLTYDPGYQMCTDVEGAVAVAGRTQSQISSVQDTWHDHQRMTDTSTDTDPD